MGVAVVDWGVASVRVAPPLSSVRVGAWASEQCDRTFANPNTSSESTIVIKKGEMRDERKKQIRRKDVVVSET